MDSESGAKTNQRDTSGTRSRRPPNPKPHVLVLKLDVNNYINLN